MNILSYTAKETFCKCDLRFRDRDYPLPPPRAQQADLIRRKEEGQEEREVEQWRYHGPHHSNHGCGAMDVGSLGCWSRKGHLPQRTQEGAWHC